MLQICEVTQNTRRGARGFILPASPKLGSPRENTLTGAEGRISHLKRSYGLRRSRLKGQQGMTTWTAWSILAYNLDTLAIRTS